MKSQRIVAAVFTATLLLMTLMAIAPETADAQGPCWSSTYQRYYNDGAVVTTRDGTFRCQNGWWWIVNSQVPGSENSPCGELMCIDINLTQQRLRAYQGQTVVIDALVSTGTIEHPTVEGKFRIYLKYLSAPMSGGSKEGGDYYNLPDVPDIMYFFDGYGIHGTYWHHNFGRPMSHGCVNMRTDQAAWLFNWAPVGTLVFIHK